MLAQCALGRALILRFERQSSNRSTIKLDSAALNLSSLVVLITSSFLAVRSPFCDLLARRLIILCDSTDFPRQWTKWSRGNVKPSPRPDDIDNSPFLCEHGRVVIDIDRELSTPTLVEAVSEKDWKALQKASVDSTSVCTVLT